MEKSEKDRLLMLEAAGEIDRLRLRNERLNAYHVHTERLLALFEGGPKYDGGMEMSVDVAQSLRQRAKELDPPEPALARPA